MKKIIILTARFPFSPGEEFIEEEVRYWAKNSDLQVTIMPLGSTEIMRDVPPDIRVDTALVGRPIFSLVILFVLSIFSTAFRNEIIHLQKKRKFSFRLIVVALRELALCNYLSCKFKSYLKKKGGVDLVYAYWNEKSVYVACLAKQAGLVGAVVSRAHGHDLYKYRRKENYMLLKKAFVNDIDHLFVLSPAARDYAITTYGYPNDKVSVSRLGVICPDRVSLPTPLTNLHILSVSSCSEVKRVDRIIFGVEDLAQKFPEKKIIWTHIGDGALRLILADLANSRLANKENVNFLFLGQLRSEEVKQFYLKNSIDFFVNLSESEGTPVSIMEAMAASVPVVAPDVGGVSDIVDSDSGLLLSQSPSRDEVAESFANMSVLCKDLNFRIAARTIAKTKFNATNNYQEFISRVKSLA